MNCAKNNRLEMLQRSPQPLYPKDVNVVDGRGNTPLYYAARHGNSDFCRFLFEKGAILNYKCEGEDTAFHMAFLSGDLATCIYLFDKGADPNSVNLECQTPIAFAPPSLLKGLKLTEGVAFTEQKTFRKTFDNAELFKPMAVSTDRPYSTAKDLPFNDRWTNRNLAYDKVQSADLSAMGLH
jgi:ankyrin repeat protein